MRFSILQLPDWQSASVPAGTISNVVEPSATTPATPVPTGVIDGRRVLAVDADGRKLLAANEKGREIPDGPLEWVKPTP